MLLVVLKLPDVKRTSEERPKLCRYCKGETFQRWGQVRKPVKDVHVRQVKVLLSLPENLSTLSGR